MIWSPGDHTENLDNLTAMNLSHLWMNNLCKSLGTSIFPTHFPGNTSNSAVHFCPYQIAPFCSPLLCWLLWFEKGHESLKIKMVTACQWAPLLLEWSKINSLIILGIKQLLFTSEIEKLHQYCLQNFSSVPGLMFNIILYLRGHIWPGVCVANENHICLSWVYGVLRAFLKGR